MSRLNQFSSLAERFEAQYTPEPNSGCWLWIGTTGRRGYGQIKHGYRTRLAHRVSYELFRGAVAPAQSVCHRCDNPSCVNPEHLFLGTADDNNKDKAAKGRAWRPAGACHPSAKLTEADAIAILQSTESGKAVAARYGVHPSTVSEIRSGRKWGHLQANYRAMKV